MVSRDPQLCRAFVARARQILSDLPTLQHEWSIDEEYGRCCLTIRKQSETGFDVVAEVFSEEIIVFAIGAHAHIPSEGDAEHAVESALGLIRDLLSPGMRVVEFQSNGRGYKWAIETWLGETWVMEEETGLLFWNYLGRRGQRVYQNHLSLLVDMEIVPFR